VASRFVWRIRPPTSMVKVRQVPARKASTGSSDAARIEG
jgi:hypothetical protein